MNIYQLRVIADEIVLFSPTVESPINWGIFDVIWPVSVAELGLRTRVRAGYGPAEVLWGSKE